MRITEIFLATQGEGKSSGIPTTFIRVFGCNLENEGGCRWCDTKYSWGGEPGSPRKWVDSTIAHIMDKVAELECPNVYVTGGEPLAADGIQELLEVLRKDYRVEIATNGTIEIPTWMLIYTESVNMDVKCPSSGMQHRTCWENLDNIWPCDQVKFVIADREDFDYALGVMQNYPTEASILFSPAWEKMDPGVLADWMIESKLWGRKLSLQQHRLIGRR